MQSIFLRWMSRIYIKKMVGRAVFQMAKAAS
jgi:hypothetical protein